MKKKSTLRLAFFTLRGLIALLLCAAACSVLATAVLAFFRPEAPAKVSQRTLTFAERVAYQRAIEDVYWRHRIWPKERPDPKPSLDTVMSQAQLEKKVADYLRNSQALEDYWQRPLTAEQLQAEMERMAKHTKQPEVLRELFEALGNDPFVIAECLARPALAERLVTSWYAYDQRIHGDLRQRADAELQAHNTVEQMKELSGKYSEVELVKSDRSDEEPNRSGGQGVKLNSGEWNQTVHKLAHTFKKPIAMDVSAFGVRRRAVPFENLSQQKFACSADTDSSTDFESAATKAYATIPAGKLSTLQEDRENYYAVAIINKADNRVRLAKVVWRKEPVDSWLAKVQNQAPTAIGSPASSYRLPHISDDTATCTDDTWAASSMNAPHGRFYPTAVWTGSEMIVWGGYEFVTDVRFDTGGRYNPSTDTWIATSNNNAPSPRFHHTAVWSGTEMIVWGGFGANALNTGGRYNPLSNIWTATNTSNAPTARYDHTTVWTGSEMIIWGGTDGYTRFNTGGRYNPSTNTWVSTSTANSPQGRYFHTAVWTGSQMIVWGGLDEFNNGLNSGGRYSPSTNTWAATSTVNAPDGRFLHTAVWTGSEMIVWAGSGSSTDLNTGGRYNPGTNTWSSTSTINAPTRRDSHTAVWTGSEMTVWGGIDESFNDKNTGGRYHPGTDSWTATSIVNAPSARDSHAAVWTGTEMIVWGGGGQDPWGLSTGGRYNPTTDIWAPTNSAPTGRSGHTTVWTGSEMIVWGGYDGDHSNPAGDTNTGGRYNPSTDTWTATSTLNAPSVRQYHTAVWTGSEMIVWGGHFYDGPEHFLNTGGRYNPAADSWAATSITNAPLGRDYHTAVWTGSEMIVWGGYNYLFLNTGGRYNPAADSWAATSITNAPPARAYHMAVWTGSEMIVWGGYNFDYLNTGGRYSPGTDSWTVTSTTNAPDGREFHTAVWTGDLMIVWGGSGSSTDLNTGGRYNPGTNIWASTSTINAPTRRESHAAVWTGSEMIVWGGNDRSTPQFFNTGGRYNPDTNSWRPTSTTNAPTGRNPTAVWTGSEMIVWGGISFGPFPGLDTGGRYCAASPTPIPTPTPRPPLPPPPRRTPPPRPTPPPP